MYALKFIKLIKEIEDTNKWKYIPCSWFGKLILSKYPWYPKQSTDWVQSL